MAATTIVNWALRAFQLLFGIVILGLSVTLVRNHNLGTLPSVLGYAAFLGGATIVAALIGLAATWVSILEGFVGMAIDAVAAILNLAGGIAVVIKLDGASCDSNNGSEKNAEKLINNEMLNGGCEMIDGEKWCGGFAGDNLFKFAERVVGKCRESKADMVFMFLTAGLFIGTALMLFLKKRKGY